MGMLAAMMQGADPAMMPGMPGMPGMTGGEEEGNPFAFPEISKEDIEKYQFLNAFSLKLIEDKVTEADIAEAKKLLGEEEVNEMLKMNNEIPEEEKKLRRDYYKLYTNVASELEESLKEQGIDPNDPNTDQGAMAKAMSGAFRKFMTTQKSNPEFAKAMNCVEEAIFNKELLYPQFQRLKKEFPKWLEENKDKIPKEQYDNHVAQYEMASQICEMFENDEKDISKFLDIMMKLPEHGTLPDEFDIDPGAMNEIQGMMGQAMGIPGMEMPGMGMPMMETPNMGVPNMGMPNVGKGPSSNLDPSI